MTLLMVPFLAIFMISIMFSAIAAIESENNDK